MLFDAYSSFVAVNVKSVLTIHILLFVLTIILMGCYVFFMVLPFVKATTFETRRIAELMSQLPAEVGGWVGGREGGQETPSSSCACTWEMPASERSLMLLTYMLVLQADLDAMLAKSQLTELLSSPNSGASAGLNPNMLKVLPSGHSMRE
jgi:hypothetical protein